MQHYVIKATEAHGVPEHLTFLPKFLKQLGYSTMAVGKWHLGHHHQQYLPTFRGFDSHVGYWNGKEDYYAHTNENQVSLFQPGTLCSFLNH
jgi:arylsulfatase B